MSNRHLENSAATVTETLRVLYLAPQLQPDSAGLYTYAHELLHSLGEIPEIHRSIPSTEAFLAENNHWLDGEVSQPNISVVNMRGMPLFQSVRGPWQSPGVAQGLARSIDDRILRPAFKSICELDIWSHASRHWPLTPVISAWQYGHSSQRYDCVHHLYPALYRPIGVLSNIVTVHDVITIRHPEWFDSNHHRRNTWCYGIVAKHATRIMADSENTKRDIMSLLGVPEERIDVVYPGVTRSIETGPMDPENMQETLARYGVQENNYIICVSTIEPRKNMVRLAQAFKEVLRRHPDLTTKLLLVGKRGWGLEDIERGLAETGLGDRLVMTGRVSQEDLVMLYQGAMAVAYVSLYEGFGLPALEALASGKPLVASNTTSLPEVVGEAGVLVDPLDVREIADSLEVIVLDEDLRADLSRRGKTQAALFTYEKTAAGAIQTYRRATQGA